MARFFIPCDVADYVTMQESQPQALQPPSFTTYDSINLPSSISSDDIQSERPAAMGPSLSQSHFRDVEVHHTGDSGAVQDSEDVGTCTIPRLPGPLVEPFALSILPVPEYKSTQRPLAIPSLIVTHPTPGSTPPPLSPPASTGSEPPEYHITSSPPKYAPIAHESETALLLASPPSFSESTVCPSCLESMTPCRRCSQHATKADWLVRCLILFNIVVWGLVLSGYYKEWEGIDWPEIPCVDVFAEGLLDGFFPPCYNAGNGTIAPQCRGPSCNWAPLRHC